MAEVPTGLASVCPICNAPAKHLEGLKDGQYCDNCQHAFVVNVQGELIQWWATQKSKPIRW